MREKEEIQVMLSYLNSERVKYINSNALSLALAMAGQIELLKWVLDIKNED